MTIRPDLHRHLSGFWGWFSRLPVLSKWGLLNLTVQLGLAIFAIVVPHTVGAMAGGAALGLASQALGADHWLFAMLKTATPGVGAAFA